MPEVPCLILPCSSYNGQATAKFAVYFQPSYHFNDTCWRKVSSQKNISPCYLKTACGSGFKKLIAFQWISMSWLNIEVFCGGLAVEMWGSSWADEEGMPVRNYYMWCWDAFLKQNKTILQGERIGYTEIIILKIIEVPRGSKLLYNKQNETTYLIWA